MNTEIRCRQCGKLIEEPGLCAGCAVLEALPDKLADRKEIAGVPFRDMKTVDEIERIKVIAETIKANPGRKIAVMVDCAPGYEGKAERYIKAVSDLLPGVIAKRKLGPGREVETIIFCEGLNQHGGTKGNDGN